jgi:hypothetical protein
VQADNERARSNPKALNQQPKVLERIKLPFLQAQVKKVINLVVDMFFSKVRSNCCGQATTES